MDVKAKNLEDPDTTYPIIPEIDLPCIPLYPPLVNLCPALSVYTEYGLDPNYERNGNNIGFGLVPNVGFVLDGMTSNLYLFCSSVFIMILCNLS